MSDFLGPKPLTVAGLDTAAAAKIGTPGSAMATALSATYAHKMNRDIRITDYCAGDGTIETAALAAAVAASAGATLVIPPAFTVKTDANLFIPSDTRIVGYGRSSVLDFQSGSGTFPKLYFDGVENARIDSITVDSSNTVARINGPGIVSFKGSTGIRLSDVIAKRSPAIGFWFGGYDTATGTKLNSEIELIDTQSIDTRADGLHISRGSHHIDIIGHKTIGAADDGIAIVGYRDGATNYAAPHHIRIRGARVRDLIATSRGLSIVGGSHIDVDDFNAHNVPAQGLLVGWDGPTADMRLNTHIRLNRIVAENAGDAGIWLAYARFLELSNSTTINPSHEGLSLFAVLSDAVVANFRSFGAGTRGINANQTVSTNADLVAEFNAAGGASHADYGLDRITIRGGTIDSPAKDAVYFTGEVARHASGLELYGVHARNVNTAAGSSGSTFGMNVTYVDKVRYHDLINSNPANAIGADFQFVNVVDEMRGLTIPALPADPALNLGETTLQRPATGSVTCTSGSLRLAFFTAKKTETITSLSCDTAATAAGATPTYAAMGVYSEDPITKDLTLIASTASSTSLLATTNSKNQRSLTSGFAKLAGQRYAIGVLVVTAATAPAMAGQTHTGASSTMSSQNPKMSAIMTGQATLPSSITASSLAVSGNMPYFELIP